MFFSGLLIGIIVAEYWDTSLVCFLGGISPTVPFDLPSGVIKHGVLEHPLTEWRFFKGKSPTSMVHGVQIFSARHGADDA